MKKSHAPRALTYEEIMQDWAKSGHVREVEFHRTDCGLGEDCPGESSCQNRWALTQKGERLIQDMWA